MSERANNSIEKQLQRNVLFFMLHFMKVQTLIIILAIIFIADLFGPAARADEMLSSFDTTLSSTIISGGDIQTYDPEVSSDSTIPAGNAVFAPSAFSPSPVPEPSSISLFAISILALVIFVKSKRPSFRPTKQAEDDVIGLC